jgi:hypothetical protein
VVAVGENCGYIRPTEKAKSRKGATSPLPRYEKKEDYQPTICYSRNLSRPKRTRIIVKIEQMDSIQDEAPQPEKKKAGRPKGIYGLKRQIQEYARNPDLALPKTDNQRIKDLKDMLIKSSGKDVVEKMISIALNDNHPAQMAAIKMCVDRTLPVSMFEKDKSQRSAVTINITGIGAPTTTVIEPSDIQDVEAKNG